MRKARGRGKGKGSTEASTNGSKTGRASRAKTAAWGKGSRWGFYWFSRWSKKSRPPRYCIQFASGYWRHGEGSEIKDQHIFRGTQRITYQSSLYRPLPSTSTAKSSGCSTCSDIYPSQASPLKLINLHDVDPQPGLSNNQYNHFILLAHDTNG